jgi:hypothetical protein
VIRLAFALGRRGLGWRAERGGAGKDGNDH